MHISTKANIHVLHKSAKITCSFLSFKQIKNIKLRTSEQNRSSNPGYMHMYIDNQTLDRQCFLSAHIILEIKNLIIKTEQ